jgi:phosphate transport system substrate-binding protein
MIWRFSRTFLKTTKRAALGAAFLLCAPVAWAEDIAVTSANGGLTLTGRFIAYDGTYLQIESAYGPLTVRYGDMTCVGVDCPDPDAYVPTFRFSGASRMADVLLPGLIEGFGRSSGYRVAFEQVDSTHATLTFLDDDAPVTVFSLRSTSTDEGFADLVAYEADAVMSVREVRPAEVQIVNDVGLGRLDDGRQSRIVALDALVPIVAPGRDLDAISMRDLSQIYSGEIKDWAEVGAIAGPVSAHFLDAGAGLTQGFVDQVVNARQQGLDPEVVSHPTFDNLIEAVVTDPGAIGLVPWTRAAFGQQLALSDTCGYRLLPMAESLKAEDYPLTTPLFLYMPQRRQAPIMRDFLAWLRTPEAQLVVRRSGFVDPAAVPIALSQQGQRFANAIALAGDGVTLDELQRMVSVMKLRTRLSTTFRFEAGSSRLDALSRSGLGDLAQGIRAGRYDGRALTLIGFSDGRGDAASNKRLSLERARAVERALGAALNGIPEAVTVSVDAFGEALPMGCDDTTWGRKLNRRVELWVD